MSTSLQMIGENRLLGLWAAYLTRRPDQMNQPQEADAELVLLPGSDMLLAATVDTLAEEIALGFYSEPETIGWMGATAALSDLAAVGADPLGLVVSVTLPTDRPERMQSGIARGLEAACRECGTFILGGDTNFSDRPSITGCALGLVPASQALTRTGCSAGELLYASGPLGLGSAAAARALFDLPADLFAERDYRPIARFKEAATLRDFATCCMDTSDGLVATLDQLMRLNHVGFELTTSLTNMLEPRARRLCSQLDTPPLLWLAGHHGEFELVFTVKEKYQKDFEGSARLQGFNPLLLGRTIEAPVIRIAGRKPQVVDSARIRNLFDEVGADLGRYLAELLQIVGKRS